MQDSDTMPYRPGETTDRVLNLNVPGYKIISELGRGGMGVVYQARQIQLNRDVALKMIRSGEQASSEEVMRFRTEAESVARLHHSNIVQIYEIGEHQGAPFFSLELCAGGSLEDKLSEGPLPVPEAVDLVRLLAQAIEMAHQSHILHRDLKPANILFTEEGEPKITDFGLAKKLDEVSHTQSGTVMGTPSYAAPEQASGKGDQLSPRTDIYALGAILYECLTGRPPFLADNVLDTFLQVLADDPVPPRQLQSKVPRDLETICLKCLQKDPGKRYAMAKELAEDLHRFQIGEPIQARVAGWWEKGTKWSRRNPAIASLLAVVVLVLLLGSGISTVLALYAQRKANLAIRQAAELTETNRNLNKTQDELERRVAQGLILPLSLNSLAPLSEPEREAFWTLALLENDPLRDRVVLEALKDPLTTRQMRLRSHRFLQAAVGLDLERRNRFEQYMLTALQNSQLTVPHRNDIALVLVDLRGLSPGTTTAVSEWLSDSIAASTEVDALLTLMPGLIEISPGLSPSDAIRSARRLVDVLVQQKDPFLAEKLTEALPFLAPRLKPGDALELALLLAPAYQANGSYGARKILALALALVAAQGKAKDILPVLSQAIHAPGGQGSVSLLLGSLSQVLGRLEPGEAALILWENIELAKNAIVIGELSRQLLRLLPRLKPEMASSLFCKGLSKAPSTELIHDYAKGLFTIKGTLKPDQSGTVCRILVEALKKRLILTSGMAPTEVLKNLEAALLRVVPQMAAPDAMAQVEAVVQAIAQSSDVNKLDALVRSLRALIAPLSPEKVIPRVANGITMTKKPAASERLAQILSTLAGHVEMPEAIRPVIKQQAGKLVEQLLRTTDAGERLASVSGMAALCDHLDPKEAKALSSRAVATLTKAMETETNDFARRLIVKGSLLIARHLDAIAAAKLRSQGAQLLASSLMASNSGFVHKFLAEDLAMAVADLPLNQAADLLMKVMLTRPRPQSLGPLSHALSQILPRMQPRERSVLIGKLLDRMAQERDAVLLPSLAHTISVLGDALEAKEAGQLRAQVLGHLGKALKDGTRILFHANLAIAYAHVAQRLEPDMAFTALTQACNSTGNAQAKQALNRAIASVRVKLKPSRAVGLLLEELRKSESPSSLSSAAIQLSGALGEMPLESRPALALEGAEALLRATQATSSVDGLQGLVESFVSLTPSMADRDVAQVSGRMAQALLKKLSSKQEARKLRWGAESCLRLLRLAGGDSTAHADRVSRILLEAILKKNDPHHLGPLVESLGLVADAHRTDAIATDLTRVATYLIQILGSAREADRQDELARLFSLMASRLARERAIRLRIEAALTVFQKVAETPTREQRTARALWLVLAHSARPGATSLARGALQAILWSGRQPLTALPFLLRAFDSETTPLDPQELINLLKHPDCLGPSRRRVLDHLESIYSERFANQWQFSRFAIQQGVDLTTPPQRPEQSQRTIPKEAFRRKK